MPEIHEKATVEGHEFRNLKEQHRGFEERLEMLRTKSFLNDEERVEEKVLKKKKLVLKDRMEAIIQMQEMEIGNEPREH
ncbi:MAG: DUF465 domain-containing protein [Acidobacteria bacterium]|nr:DUF465 domain-containing protein [Acidobacteriota bacterium]